jgi:hypothetical protein
MAPTTTTSPFDVPSPDPLVEALTQELVKASTSGTLALSAGQARCVSSGMLTRLGPDVLARLGSAGAASLDVAALDPAQRQAFADAVVGCLDLRQVLVDQVGVTLGLSAADKSCLADRVADDGTLIDVVRRAVVDGTDPAGSEQTLTAPMYKALTACLSPEQLARLGKPR